MAIRETGNPGFEINNPGQIPATEAGRIFWRYNDANNKVQSFDVDLTNWTARTQVDGRERFGVRVKVKVSQADGTPVAELEALAGESARVNVRGLQVEQLRDVNGDPVVDENGDPVMWIPGLKFEEVEIEIDSEPVGG